jgi:toluene monooxygenase electron transfer component
MRIAAESHSGKFAFECGEDETILEAGLRHGFTLPYECATGTCGTCRARVMEGEATLAWKQAPGLAKLKLDRGDILMCQARARRDCRIRIPAEIAGPANNIPDRRQGAIRNLRRLTRDVIDFEVALSRPMKFEAGQFVVLRHAELQGGRAYSMVNFDPETERITLLVKRKPGGGFGDWLFERCADGACVEVFGPLGTATFRPEEGRNVLCIAGGSGIAGMMSILEHARRANYFAGRRGYFFFGIRTMADTFYLDALSEYVRAAGGGLEVTVALSDEPARGPVHPQFPHLELATGLVHECASRGMAGRYDELVGFAAGPPPMVDAALRVFIAEAKLAPERIRYDKFT